MHYISTGDKTIHYCLQPAYHCLVTVFQTRPRRDSFVGQRCWWFDPCRSWRPDPDVLVCLVESADETPACRQQQVFNYYDLRLLQAQVSRVSAVTVPNLWCPTAKFLVCQLLQSKVCDILVIIVPSLRCTSYYSPMSVLSQLLQSQVSVVLATTVPCQCCLSYYSPKSLLY